MSIVYLFVKPTKEIGGAVLNVAAKASVLMYDTVTTILSLINPPASYDQAEIVVVSNKDGCAITVEKMVDLLGDNYSG